jgi:endonuclease YncB( thermonuclease family)
VSDRHDIAADLWWYPATIDRDCYFDGDTLGSSSHGGVHIDTGFYTTFGPVVIRFAGIDAPELPTEEGEAAKSYLASLLDASGWRIVLHCASGTPAETFGRYVARVFTPDGVDVCQAMLDTGHAVSWP